MGATEKISTVANKYPTYRDDKIRGCFSWLAGKRVDDNAEQLWRVHDKIYDLTDFITKHPGGKEWLELTKGTDVTEQFESYHITSKASLVLKKYYVKDADLPRNYKLTYKDDGFYRTLKRRVAAKMEHLDREPIKKSKLYFNLNLMALILFTILTASCKNWYNNLAYGLFAALHLAWLSTLTHNYTHQPNNWRMYMSNLTLMGWRDWRVFHAMSHHLYPNSYHDMEVSSYEPYLPWIPEAKTKLQIYFSYFATPFVYMFLFKTSFLIRLSGFLKSKKKVLYWDDLISLLLPLTMLLFVDSSVSNVYKVIGLWFFILSAASFMYSLVAVNAGHHGLSNVHEGDEVLSLDFGIFQLGATIDRQEANSNQFMVLTHFGEHIMHHMFPSLDHGLLPQLKNTLIETCKDFDVEMRQQNFYQALVGQFHQLGRTETISLNDKINNNKNE